MITPLPHQCVKFEADSWPLNNHATNQVATRMLRIIQCSDPSLWYAGLVGELVPYCGQWREAYASREPAGYINRVEFKDAEVVEADAADTMAHRFIKSCVES